MPFIVVYDACVLYPAPLRDLLVRLAIAGVVQAKWTNKILDECFAAVARTRPELTLERLARTRDLMNAAVRDVLVEDYAGLMDGLQLPDPDDRHVLAAAIRCGAQAIITANLRDFPATALSPYGIEAVHPDDFVLDTLDLSPGVVYRVLQEQAASLRHPVHTVEDILTKLEGNGLVRAAAQCRLVFRT